MRTRQKFLSLVMAFIMILSILPSTASAEEQEGDATAACTRTEGCTLEDGHEGECVLPDEPEDEPEPEDGTDDLDTAEPEEQEELIAPAALEDTLTGSGTEEAPYVVSSQEELAAAVAQGGSIKLEDDIYLTEIITIPEGKSITLDLNGKAITVSQTSGRSLYAIDNKGTFTLTDSSSDGDGSITARGVENYGTMYMEGGTINSCDSNGGGAAVWNEGTFEMAGGALKFTGQKSGNNAGSPFANAKSTAKATITGGELESPYTCMFVNGGQVTVENISVENSTSYWMAFKAFSGAELTLKNVTVNSKDGGCVEAAGGTVNLEDCTFNQGPQTEAPGEVHTSSAVAVSNNGTVNVKSGSYTSAGFGAYVFNSGGTINIEGGTFEANTVLKADDSTNSNRSTIHVSGGDFTGELSIGNESTLIAEGGAFSATLDKKYLPDTVKTTTDADGKTVVTKLTETDEGVVAKVGSDCYKSLSAAIAAGDNDIVTLLQDTTENVTIAATQNITLDLNGKTLNGGSNQEAAHKSKAAITNNGTITIQDSSNPSTGVIKRGDVKVASAYYVIDNQGTMTIKSGTVMNDSGVRGQGASLIRNAGLATEATLNIEGGTFQQDNFLVIKNDDHGILNIAGGHFISKNDSAVQNWANANISGGTIEGIVYTSVWSNDFEAAKTEISGDVVITGRIVATQTGNGLTVAPEVKINGGNLDITSWRVQNADFIDISGGHFSKPVKPEYLNESLTHELQAASGDYPYSYYKTLEDAQKAAGPNDTVAEVVTKETGKTYYTVTLVYDDGATAKEVKTVVKDESIDLPEPNRSGYNFNGWYNGSTKVDSPYTVSADVTLTAQWAKKITPVTSATR